MLLVLLWKFESQFLGGHKKHQGRFGKVDRQPNVPPDRTYCKTLSQWPRKPVSLMGLFSFDSFKKIYGERST